MMTRVYELHQPEPCKWLSINFSVSRLPSKLPSHHPDTLMGRPETPWSERWKSLLLRILVSSLQMRTPCSSELTVTSPRQCFLDPAHAAITACLAALSHLELRPLNLLSCRGKVLLG